MTRKRSTKKTLQNLACIATSYTHKTDTQLEHPCLGIDYGMAKCGIALSLDGYTDLPLTVVPTKAILCTLEELSQEKHITHYYWGLPISGNGQENELCTIIRTNAEKLTKKTAIPHTFINEWGSTVRTIVDDDSLSACRILSFARSKKSRILLTE